MAIKILEQSGVVPSNGPAQPRALRLTFFDVVWCALPTCTERLFLYDIPNCSTSTFLNSHLPKLKHSLSLTLNRFYPLAGQLVPDTDMIPSLCYSPGDSVVIVVAVSDDDIRVLASDGPKDAARLRALVPTLLFSEIDQRVVSLQVTLFPDQGIGIGITYHHAAMDGSSALHFMRTWAAICKSGNDEGITEHPPLFDRTLIPDPMGLRVSFFPEIKQWRTTIPSKANRQRPDVVRSTFRLTLAQLDQLRKWVASKTSTTQRCSSFALSVALVWTCLHKTGHRPPKEIEALLFSVDCRARFNPPIPASYFGNCLGSRVVKMERNVLVGDDGVATAAVSISEVIKTLEVEGVLQEMLVNLLREAGMIFPLEPMTVAGSPRLNVYRVDFGWGGPSKGEVVSIDGCGTMSLSENRDDGMGGVEIGMAFPGPLMEKFTSIFYESLEMLTSSC